MSKDSYQVPTSDVALEIGQLAQIANGYVPGRTVTVSRSNDDVVTVQSLDGGDVVPLVHVVSFAQWSHELRTTTPHGEACMTLTECRESGARHARSSKRHDPEETLRIAFQTFVPAQREAWLKGWHSV